jgi:hypothetical protein
MKQVLTPALARVFKRLHYPFDVMLMCVRWYVAYGLSVRNLEEMMAERGIEVDHSIGAPLGNQTASNPWKSVPSPQAPGGQKLACR